MQRIPAMPATDPYYELLTAAINDPRLYKLCLVCGNVNDTKVRECKYCSAYRFDTDPEHVSNAALDQATHERTAVTTPEMTTDD